MNGGVSLAVWMGGVTYEIDRLRTGAGGWSSVVETMATDVRVDVIAGASAGGINGAFLAAAMVFDRDLLPIRDLWVNKGSFQDLLRDPLDASMPSLLKGDAYFLPELQRAFRLLTGGTPVHQRLVPIELTLTTTALTGRATTRPDDFGTVIADVTHAEELTFGRGPGTADSDDPFRWHDIAARLALAARCSASFPGAFEPSWCPVGESSDADHPDMARHASFKQSRFLVDGGVLVNKPVGPALESIYAQRSDRQTRRVLVYLVPDPGEAGGPVPDDRAVTPAPGRVVFDSLVSLPRVESIAGALDHYRQHNDDVHSRRGARDALVCNLTPAAIVTLAGELFESYKVARRMSSCSYVADEVARGLNAWVDDGYVPWHRDRLLAMLYSADLQWIPQSLDELRSQPGRPWSWGAFPIERVAGIVLDLVRRAYYVTPFGSREREELGQVRGEVHDLLLDLRERRTAGRRTWRLPLTHEQFQALLRGPAPVDAVTNAVLLQCEAALAQPVDADWAELAARARLLFERTGRILNRVLDTGTVASPTTPTPLNRPETEILCSSFSARCAGPAADRRRWTEMTPPLPLRFVTSADDLRHLPDSRAEVAVVGRSNVGKSSLINALSGRNGLAKVSKTPGRTRLLNCFVVENDEAATVIDCPGYGYAEASKTMRASWQVMIERYLLEREPLAMVVVLVDGEIGPTRLDLQLLEWLREHELPHAIVATKHDKVKSSYRPKRAREVAAGCKLDVADVVWVSAVKGTGVDRLRSLMHLWLTTPR